MANTTKATAAVPVDHDFIRPDDLHFDLENPRFLDQKFKDEIEIIQYLYDHVDVDELIQSILSAGYIDFEPLIVLRGKLTVLEGNRRLAALKLIAHEDIRKKLRVDLPAIDNPKLPPKKIRVRLVATRTEARDFIGFKHINGPFKWDALAKAKYAAAWYREGGDIATISRTLGDNHNTVRRLVNGWFVLQQAIADGFDLSQISNRNFAFSHLYTGLTRSSVREFLGLSGEDLLAPPKANPISPEHRKDMELMMSWLYGQEQKKEPTIIQSQNPNLNQLSKVLSHPEAKAMLIASRNLGAAFERVEPPSSRFEDALLVASKQCEEVMGLSGFYDGDPTLMRVAEGVQKTIRSLVLVMRDKSNAKNGNE